MLAIDTEVLNDAQGITCTGTFPCRWNGLSLSFENQMNIIRVYICTYICVRNGSNAIFSMQLDYLSAHPRLCLRICLPNLFSLLHKVPVIQIMRTHVVVVVVVLCVYLLLCCLLNFCNYIANFRFGFSLLPIATQIGN